MVFVNDPAVTVITPLLDALTVFASAVSISTPSPFPLDGDAVVTVSQLMSLLAVQSTFEVITVTLVDSPCPETFHAEADNSSDDGALRVLKLRTMLSASPAYALK